MVTWRQSTIVDAKPTDVRGFARERQLKLRDQALTIAIRQHAWKSMRSHVDSSLVEVGGIFVGEAFSDLSTGQIVVDVHQAIPAKGALETPTYFRFTPAAWEAISQQRDALHPDLLTVGWYHSHPKLGVFYSGTDRASQQAFFNRSWNFGIVIDPWRDEFAAFLGGESDRANDGTVQIYDWSPTIRIEPPKPVEQIVGAQTAISKLEPTNQTESIASTARPLYFWWIAALSGLAAICAISIIIRIKRSRPPDEH